MAKQCTDIMIRSVTMPNERGESERDGGRGEGEKQ